MRTSPDPRASERRLGAITGMPGRRATLVTAAPPTAQQRIGNAQLSRDPHVARLIGARTPQERARAVEHSVEGFIAVYQARLPANAQAEPGFMNQRIRALASSISDSAIGECLTDVLDAPGVGDALQQACGAGLEVAPSQKLAALLIHAGVGVVSNGADGTRVLPRLLPAGLVSALGELGGAAATPSDSVVVDLLDVVLFNLPGPLRAEVQGDSLFRAMRRGLTAAAFLLASGGHEEQHYTSSCPIAARDQLVLSRIGNLAGEIIVGRKLAQELSETIAAQRDRLVSIPCSQDGNVFAHASKQLTRSKQELGGLYAEAFELAAAERPDPAAILSLTPRWSKAMQRMAAVVDAGHATVADPRISALSDKIISGQWGLSSAIMVAPVLVQAVASGSFAAHMEARFRPLDEDVYTEKLAAAGVPTTTADLPAALNVRDVQLSADGWTAKMGTLWSYAFQHGGLPFSVPGHALVLRAVKVGTVRSFLVGDPKANRFGEFDQSALARYLAARQISIG